MKATTRFKTSVTRELDDATSPLRELLRPHQPLIEHWRRAALAELSGRPWIRPRRTQLAWMAGMAIDYRTRWWLTGVDTMPSPVLAGLGWCLPSTADELLEAFSQVQFLSPGPHQPAVERAIVNVAVGAASVEPLFRAGPVPCALDQLGLPEFLAAHEDVVADVLAMSECLATLLPLHAASPVDCGPVVATGRLAGDADLVVDGRLIEIKAVVDPRRSMTRAIQQLVVYAARLRPVIAAVLLPRQHTLVEFDLTPHQERLAELDAEIQASYAT